MKTSGSYTQAIQAHTSGYNWDGHKNFQRTGGDIKLYGTLFKIMKRKFLEKILQVDYIEIMKKAKQTIRGMEKPKSVQNKYSKI